MVNPWFKVFDPPSGKCDLRICAFHHAGGSSGFFQKWRKQLPPSWGLVLVELPGRGARYKEPVIEDFTELVSKMAKNFEESIQGSVLFAGHSMGALLAFELYRRINSEQKENVRGLLVSSFLPPTTENLALRRKLSHLPEEGFLSEIRKHAEIPQEILSNAPAKSFFLGQLRSDFRLLESYQNTNLTKTDLPILVSGGAQDPIVDSGKLGDWDLFGQLIGEPRIFPGDHFYINQHYPQIIAALVAAFS
jgi:medium-chain acyl-[acyl-carrier-protein] hydrolase